MYYATGARYEGLWSDDKKEGEGVYVFENGEVRCRQPGACNLDFNRLGCK
jgi:hypothetical protein